MRQKTLEYKFKDIIVSKKNFLSTLGYKHDSVIRCLLSSNEKNTRKDWSFPRYERTIRTNKLPESYKEKVVKFIESFRPCPSHYRILHAPNRRYLPPGLTASAIFTQLNQMLASENGKSCSWSYFHNIYKSMNISSSTPENDKCSLCTEHERMFCISWYRQFYTFSRIFIVIKTFYYNCSSIHLTSLCSFLVAIFSLSSYYFFNLLRKF